jgi:hypothetical protein
MFGKDRRDYLIKKPISMAARWAALITNGSNDKAGFWHSRPIVHSIVLAPMA